MPLLCRLEGMLSVDEAQLKINQLVVAVFPDQSINQSIYQINRPINQPPPISWQKSGQVFNEVFTKSSARFDQPINNKNKIQTNLIFCSSLSWLRAVSSIFSNLLATACTNTCLFLFWEIQITQTREIQITVTQAQANLFTCICCWLELIPAKIK